MFAGFDLASGPDSCIAFDYDGKTKTISNIRTMNQQPDTRTLEGKIAVMQAAQKFIRVENKGKRNEYSNWELIELKFVSWNWNDNDYRIHPDDLNPPPKPTYRPWTFDEIPLGKMLQAKSAGYRGIITTVFESGNVLVGAREYTRQEVLNKFTDIYGEPCGIKEVL